MMIRLLFLFTIIFSLKLQAIEFVRLPASIKTEKTLSLIEWESVRDTNSLILSEKNYYKAICPKIEKHLESLVLKDNVNILYPTERNLLQKCNKYSLKENKKKKVSKKKVVEKKAEEIEPDENVLVEDDGEVKESKEIKEEESIQDESISKNDFKKNEDFIIILGTGLISEYYDEKAYSDFSFRYGFLNFLSENTVFNLNVDFSKNVLYGESSLMLSFYNPLFFSFNFGNRIGFEQRSSDNKKISNIMDAYTGSSLGYLMRKNGINFKIETGITFNTDPTLNFRAFGMKKINDDFSIGAYFEYKSTDYKIYYSSKKDNRNLILTGILISY